MNQYAFVLIIGFFGPVIFRKSKASKLVPTDRAQEIVKEALGDDDVETPQEPGGALGPGG